MKNEYELNQHYDSLKPIPGEEKYIGWDEDVELWCVFGSESGFAYASFSSWDEADDWLEQNL